MVQPKKKKQKSSLKVRVLTSIIGLPLLGIILYLGQGALVIGVSLLTLVGTLEYTAAVNHVLKPRIRYTLMLSLSLLMVLTIKLDYNFALAMLLICFILLSCYEITSKNIGFERAGAMLLGLVYVPIMFGHLFLFETLNKGVYYLWLIFIIAFATDTAAYFIGSTIGRKKLAPRISPKKTVAGSLGGILAAAIVAVIYGRILRSNFDLDLAWYLYFAIGIVASIAGQCGDLLASMIKRRVGIKDFSKILPGHGGILDRFDSIIFIIPIIYIFARLTSGIA